MKQVTMTHKNLDIRQNVQHKMFFVKVSGGIAYLKYDQPKNRLLEYKETYVPVSSRHKGVASELVIFAMNYAKSRDYQVFPTCPFVNNFIEKNPEYKEIVK